MLLIVLSLYSLVLSRTGEAHTVWEVLHPAFIPVLLVATFLLFNLLLSSKRVTHKLLFVIFHSILIHSLFSVIFPAGDLSGQQTALGKTRLIYDNVVLHGGFPRPLEPLQSQIFKQFGGINLQAALSVIFARMLGIDVFMIHLSLVPTLWGVFVPISVFLTAKTLRKNDNVAIFSSFILSAFPYSTYFGAISVPISLGFIFFFYSMYFTLKSLESNDRKSTFLMLTFLLMAFSAHYLTGVMSLSILVLATAFKAYKNETLSIGTVLSLVLSFAVSASLLPLSLVYLRFFSPTTQTTLTLDKLFELPLQEIAGLFLFGELIYGFDLKTILLVAIGPLLALLYAIYLFQRLLKTGRARSQIETMFYFTVLLMILVDYRILKIFMDRLPFNAERLWVFSDFVAVPFVAMGISALVTSLKAFMETKSRSIIPINRKHRAVSKRLWGDVVNSILNLHLSDLLLISNVLLSLVLAGWTTASLSAAYPHAAPLQTTWYELEAVKYIDENTTEKYVVIGDVWTIFAGQMIVGINNPNAYYFAESNKTGHDLFVNMKSEPSPQWMLQAMNYTDTAIAYFVVTEPRLGIDEFNSVISRALQNTQLKVIRIPNVPTEKLYVFGYSKE